ASQGVCEDKISRSDSIGHFAGGGHTGSYPKRLDWAGHPWSLDGWNRCRSEAHRGYLRDPRIQRELGGCCVYQSAEAIQRFSGIVPVTERSGKTKFVHRRLACPKFVR